MHRLSDHIIRSHIKQQNAHRVWQFQTQGRMSHNVNPKSNPVNAYDAQFDTLPDTIEFEAADYDETVMNFSDEEGCTITQVDEAGITHTIVLSPDMLRCIYNRGLAWKAAANRD